MLRIAFLIGLGVLSQQAIALEGEWNDIRFNFKSTVTAGLAIRAEERDLDLVAKLSVPGQRGNDLCSNANNGCTTVEGNAAFIRARGQFGGVNADDGNWNYEKGDITDSLVLFSPEIKLQRGDIKMEFSGLFFYDPVNADFTEFHADNTFQPTHTPREQEVVDAYARGAELRKAFVQVDQDILGQSFSLKVGRQVLPWGEALTVLFNNLNQLNPLDANAAARPGFQVSDVSVPVNMAVLSFPIGDSLSAEFVVPLEWRPVNAPPHGSFSAISDIPYNHFITLGGNIHEDPNFESKVYYPASLISSSSYTSKLMPYDYGNASNKGQYGGRLTYVADWLNDGTEIGLHYLRYHSQLPYLSGFAAKSTCIRPTTNNIAMALVDCGGFKGSLFQGGQEPLPINTSIFFLDYPENIDLFGLSFNTNVFGVALSGEYAYRPNMPLQIHTTDVVYALTQPALPKNEINGGVATLPSRDRGLPSYLAAYRGGIEPEQLVRGYERFPVSNVSISGLKLFPNNPFGADDMISILELGATYVHRMTDFHVLPLNGPGDNTHPSAGADGTGNGSGSTAPDTGRLTPTTQTFNIPTALSYGYRTVNRLIYHKLIPGAVFEPTLTFFHDLKGITPSPATNFVQGRRSASLTMQLRFPNELLLGAGYEAKFGGSEKENIEADRDRIVLYSTFSF
jgi:hypothetical protein